MVDTFEDILEQNFKKLYNIDKETDERLKTRKVIETGAMSLDVSLGIGGIPRGKVTFIYGREGSGKTHLVLEIAKNAVVYHGLNVLYIDSEAGLEQRLVEEYFKGLDYTIEGNILHYTLTYNGHWIKVMKAKSFEDGMKLCETGIKSKEIGMCIVDSISAGSPDEELEKELTESTMTQQSRLLAKFFRRNIFDILMNEIAMIFIGQVRDKIGSYYADVEPTGGHAIKHFASIEIKTTSMMGEKNMITQNKVPIGIQVICVIQKNKLAPPFRRCTIPVIFGKGIDRFRDVVTFAESLGVINTRGAWYYFGEERLGHGFVNTMTFLDEHKETLDKIRELIYNLVTKERTIDEQISDD